MDPAKATLLIILLKTKVHGEFRSELSQTKIRKWMQREKTSPNQ
jgi:hypothetical protein